MRIRNLTPHALSDNSPRLRHSVQIRATQRRRPGAGRHLAVCICSAFAWAIAGSHLVPGEQGVAPQLFLEPIPGLTTARYPAPESMTVPVGTLLTVCHSLPTDPSPRSRGGDDDLTIAWDGARSLGIVRGMAMAECPMNEPGEQLIRAVIGSRDGRRWESRCKVTVIAAQRESTRGLRVVPIVEAIPLDENATNFDTMPLFFGGSIATIGPQGGRTAAGTKRQGVRYGTTVGKTVRFGVETAPLEFSDLIEVRPEKGLPFLAAHGSYGISDAGIHRFTVGPLRNPLALVIETYTVKITSHSSGLDIVPEGQPITFEAVTDPPGYESNITWLSSTKYGTAHPVLGRGPTFTAQFDNTWGPDPATGDPIQWLGVKADNVVFNQDQKCPVDIGLAYGVRQEGGEFWAYIETEAAQELIAVPFDDLTEVEDYQRARLIGLTIAEMELLVGQPNDPQIALLRSQIVVTAGNLWSDGFSCFSGTDGQLHILRTMSTVLEMVRRKVQVFGGPWVANGCTGVPNFLLAAAVIACCDAHDACYCTGGKEADRLACDVGLLTCIVVAGYPKTGALFYAAVRAFGASHFNYLPC